MDRREFLTLAAASAAVSSIPGARALAGADEWRLAFHAALRERPWLLGWLGTEAEKLETPSLSIAGRWPAGLAGTFYRNGPAGHELAGRRYRHWFDGDGMVQAFRFADGKVAHIGRMVATSKYRAERAAGRRLRATFGTVDPDFEPIRSTDSINPANISVLAHGGRVLALWEGGSPYEVDPSTLETKGPYAWTEPTRGVPFSAHPRLEPDGTLWSIGYVSMMGVLVVYHVGADGKLREAVPLRPGAVPMVHDFVVTQRHLVIVVPPIAIERRAGVAMLDTMAWRPEQPARVLIVDKSDLTRVRTVEMPAHFTFHYGNAWEDADGTIRFDMARFDGPEIMLVTLREVMRGEWVETGWGRHHVVTIDHRGAVREERIAHDWPAVEFPFVDRRKAGRRYRKITLVVRSPRADVAHPHLNSIGSVDLQTGKVESFPFAPSELPEEHVFVPRPAGTAEDDGWLIGTCLDFKAGVTRLNVFDAARVLDGPVAVASLPYALPLGFHGTFVPAGRA
jgi:carotenoid cleavage dioxygenase